jgi:hypothetical protein
VPPRGLTSGSSGLRYGGMAIAWCGWQAPRRLRSPLSHTVLPANAPGRAGGVVEADRRRRVLNSES